MRRLPPYEDPYAWPEEGEGGMPGIGGGGDPYAWPTPSTRPDDRGSRPSPKSTPQSKVALLRKLGYSIPNSWGRAAEMAWKNYLAATKRGLDARSVAKFWNKNSKWSIMGARGPLVSNPKHPDNRTGAKRSSPGSIAATNRQRAQQQAGLDGNYDLPTPWAGTLISEKGLPEAGSIDESWAERLAAAEFDGAIKMLQGEIDEAPRQTAHNLAQLESWYNTVLGSQATAAQRDAEIGKAGVDSIRGIGEALVASLGGSANAASGGVAAQAQGDAGTLQALATAQDQYNTDIAPLLRAESAGVKAQEQNRGSQVLRELANQMLGLKTERGGAKSRHSFDIMRENMSLRDAAWDRLMNVRQYNNNLRQQYFQNELASANLGLAAKSFDLDVFQAMNSGTRAKPGKGTFAGLSNNDRLKFRSGFINDLIEAKDQGASTQEIVSRLNDNIRGQGWGLKNPAVRAFAMNILKAAGINPDPRWYGGYY